MDKPLHDSIVPPSLFADPEAAGKFLVAIANNDFKQFSPDLAIRWVKRIERYGVTDSLLADVDREVRRTRFTARIQLDWEKGIFVWVHEDLPDKELVPDREAFYALLVAWSITAGTADKIRRCEIEDCRRYFIGKSNKKWCSETCGSRFRVRDKRKKDKQRQML